MSGTALQNLNFSSPIENAFNADRMVPLQPHCTKGGFLLSWQDAFKGLNST